MQEIGQATKINNIAFMKSVKTILTLQSCQSVTYSIFEERHFQKQKQDPQCQLQAYTVYLGDPFSVTGLLRFGSKFAPTGD